MQKLIKANNAWWLSEPEREPRQESAKRCATDCDEERNCALQRERERMILERNTLNAELTDLKCQLQAKIAEQREWQDSMQKLKAEVAELERQRVDLCQTIRTLETQRATLEVSQNSNKTILLREPAAAEMTEAECKLDTAKIMEAVGKIKHENFEDLQMVLKQLDQCINLSSDKEIYVPEYGKFDRRLFGMSFDGAHAATTPKMVVNALFTSTRNSNVRDQFWALVHSLCTKFCQDYVYKG